MGLTPAASKAQPLLTSTTLSLIHWVKEEVKPKDVGLARFPFPIGGSSRLPATAAAALKELMKHWDSQTAISQSVNMLLPLLQAKKWEWRAKEKKLSKLELNALPFFIISYG